MATRQPDESNRSWWDTAKALARMTMTKRGVTVGSAGALAIVGSIARVSGGASAAAGVVAYLGVGLATSETACTIFRALKTPHWKIAGIRVYLLCEVLLTELLIGLAVTQFTIEPSIYVVAFGYLVVFLLFPGLHWAIGKKVGRRTRTYYFRHWKVFGHEMQDWLRGPSVDSKFHAVASRVFIRRKGMTAYAALTYLVISAIFAVDAGAAGSHFIRTHKPAVLSGAAKAGQNQKGGGRHSRAGAPSSGSSRPSSGSTSNSASPGFAPQLLSWSDLCGQTRPGSDAPNWARGKLYDLYLGPGGPGALIAGCPGPTQTIDTNNNFVYLVGRSGGATLSVAVASRDSGYPATIFLGGAAQLALDLINSDGAIGGSTRIDRAAGDLYLAYSKSGTSAFVRRTKNSTFTFVPSAIVDEWYADMTVVHQWLWPEVTSVDPTTGEISFTFVSDTGDTSISGIRYSKSLQAALIDAPGGGVIEHTAFGRLVPAKSFEAFPLQ